MFPFQEKNPVLLKAEVMAAGNGDGAGISEEAQSRPISSVVIIVGTWQLFLIWSVSW